MFYFFFLLLRFNDTLHAYQQSAQHFRFSIEFPDAAPWQPAEQNAQGASGGDRAVISNPLFAAQRSSMSRSSSTSNIPKKPARNSVGFVPEVRLIRHSQSALTSDTMQTPVDAPFSFAPRSLSTPVTKAPAYEPVFAFQPPSPVKTVAPVAVKKSEAQPEPVFAFQPFGVRRQSSAALLFETIFATSQSHIGQQA